MRVLLTNDDGFFAPGMSVLKGVACEIFSEVWISAPMQNCSGMSRSISVDSQIKVKKVREREFAVGGTPVDSALLGLHIMMKVASVKPDLVLSGINYGSNVGSKILYSGTIAAASAAAASTGIPSIAISQEYRGSQINWKNSEKTIVELVKQLVNDERWNKKSVMSINVPHSDILGTKFVEQGEYCPCGSVAEFTSDEHDSEIYSICDVNKEVPLQQYGKACSELLREGYVIITPVTSDMTDYSTLELFSAGNEA